MGIKNKFDPIFIGRKSIRSAVKPIGIDDRILVKAPNRLLQENGSFLLLEDDERILL
jgi:hypothetical protein